MPSSLRMATTATGSVALFYFSVFWCRVSYVQSVIVVRRHATGTDRLTDNVCTYMHQLVHRHPSVLCQAYLSMDATRSATGQSHP